MEAGLSMYGYCDCGNPFNQPGGYYDLGMCGVCATGEAAGVNYITAPCPGCRVVMEFDGRVHLCVPCKDKKKKKKAKDNA